MDSSRTRLALDSVRKPLSVVAFLAGLGLLVCTFAVLRRGLPDDSLIAVVTTVLGGGFQLAAVAGFQSSKRAQKSEQATIRWSLPAGVLRLISFALGTIAFAGFFTMLREPGAALGIGCLGSFLLWYSLQGLPALYCFVSRHRVKIALLATLFTTAWLSFAGYQRVAAQRSLQNSLSSLDPVYRVQFQPMDPSFPPRLDVPYWQFVVNPFRDDVWGEYDFSYGGSGGAWFSVSEWCDVTSP